MTKNGKESSQDQREELKHHKLEYAYSTPDNLGSLPTLGSIVRGLGKRWNICVVTEASLQKSYKDFQNTLTVQENLSIISPDEFETTNFSHYQLVLFQGIESNRLTQFRNSNKLLGKAHVMAIDNSPSDEYDLISSFKEEKLNDHGVTAITGSGKGKTTSALGFAPEILTQKGKIAVIQWFKERKSGDLTWAINEHEFPHLLKVPGNLVFHPTGLGFYGSPNLDRVKGDQAYKLHREKAYEGLNIAKSALENDDYKLVILDELVDTVLEIAQNIEFPLIDLEDMQQFLTFCNEQNKHVVVTGRRVTDHWSQFVGNSITIQEVKHPWSSKKRGAISGLDF